jgi:hypothetical protein
MEADDWREHYDLKAWSNEHEDGFYLVSKEATIKPRCQFFPIAASITSNARVELQRNIAQCQEQGFKVVYCDTDSILCESINDLEMGAELGQWSLEAEVDKAWIAGKKLYCLQKANGDYKTASKGVRASPDDIKRVCDGELVTVYNDAPTFSATRPMTYQKRRIRMT